MKSIKQIKDPGVMDLILEDTKVLAEERKRLKLGICIACWTVLLLIWLPGMSIPRAPISVAGGEGPAMQRRVLLKKPAPKPKRVRRANVQPLLKRKVPMPEILIQTPEPEIVRDNLPAPEIVDLDTWEFVETGELDGKGDGNSYGGLGVAEIGQAGVIAPVFTHKVSPRYPVEALKVRLQGAVVFEAILRKNGEITDIRLLRGLGEGRFGFEREARKALALWEFRPGRLDDKPVDVRAVIQVDFILY